MGKIVVVRFFFCQVYIDCNSDHRLVFSKLQLVSVTEDCLLC